MNLVVQNRSHLRLIKVHHQRGFTLLMYLMFVLLSGSTHAAYPTTAVGSISWNKCNASIDILMYLESDASADHLNHATVSYKTTGGSWENLYTITIDQTPAVYNTGFRSYGGSASAYYGTVAAASYGQNQPINPGVGIQGEGRPYDNSWGHSMLLHIYKLPSDIEIVNGSIQIQWTGEWYGGSFQNFGSGITTLSLNDITPPSGLTATQNLCSTIELTWNTPAQLWQNSQSCGNYGSYTSNVYRNNVLIASNITSNQFVDNTLSFVPGTNYSYNVQTSWISATNGVMNPIRSVFSNTATGKVKDLPNQVASFNATDDRCDGTIRLSWNWSEANPDTFELRRNGVVISNLPGTSRSLDQTSLPRGTTYTYSIRAKNNCGLYSIGVSDAGISPADPSIATGVTATISGTSVIVSWADNANNETSYKIVRQDDLGNTVYFDANANTTSFTDDGVATCRTYTYKVKVFSDCVSGGLVSASSNAVTLPPPNISSTFDATHNLTGSKGYFTNRVELSFTANNTQNLDQIKIYRKILGTTDSTLISAVNPASGLYIDYNAEARVYYEYTLIGEKNCNNTLMTSNITKDVGFRNPLGTISGHIEFNGGVAVADARVIANPSSGDAGYSLKFNGGSASVADNPNLEPGTQCRLDFWINPINHNDGNILNKGTAISVSHTGTDYVVTLNNGSPHSVTFADTYLPIGNWRPVSVQYNGSAMIVLVNGVQVGSTTFSGSITNNASSMTIGGGASHFYFDEFRLMANATDSLTAVRDGVRYLNGNEAGFRVSLHCDEGVGTKTYDVSKQGNVYNANHFSLSGAVSFDLERPSSAQLSYIAYTDSLGNYIISGVRYNGSGDNYTIIPSKGVHSFSPNSRSIYMGDQSLVFNNQDFMDISSFTVEGYARYYNPNATATNCYVDEAGLYVDGQPVVVNGVQAKTNAAGYFNIQVPIGSHLVHVAKFQHNFSDSALTMNFQAPVSGIEFRDTTTRKVVGRVAGGLTEANKAPGMGRSNNNLGVAKIRFISPITATAATACFMREVTTNSATGEYTTYLPPLQYKIDTVFVLTAPLIINPSNLTNSNVTFNLKNFVALTSVTDTLFDSNGGVVSVDSITYTKRLDFIHRITPTVNFTDTLGNKFIGEDTLFYGGSSIAINNNLASGWGDFGWPVFKQGKKYFGDVSANEVYTNYDNAQKDTVPLMGYVNFTNNLINGADPTPQVDLVNGRARYDFVTGDPNNSTGSIPAFDFTSPLQITVVPQGAPAVQWKPNVIAYPSNPEYRAYIVGSKITGTGVATLGPERVDYILRDPAGSESSATWTTGHATTTQHQFSATTAGSATTSTEIKVGFEQSVGLGVQVPVQVEATAGLGLTIEASATIGGGFMESVTSSNSVSTRDDADHVGADADIFIGRSRNWLVGPTSNIELIDAAVCSNAGVVCFGPTVGGKRLSKKLGYAIQPSDVKTRFSYTQSEIENVVIPTLESLRNVKLAGSLYNNHLPAGDSRYGANNDDPIFGTAATSTTPFVYEAADVNGLSYEFLGTAMDNDTVRTINQQIALWKQALAQNEREKWKAINNQGGILLDNFTLGSAIVSNSYSTDSEASVNIDWELSLSLEQKTAIGAEAGGVGASVERTLSLSETVGGSHGFTQTSSTSFEYTLTDGDDGDIFSIDVYASSEGTGNIFVTRGGRSMCPYEDAVQPHYFDPGNPFAPITSHSYIANPSATIQLATIQREMPDIVITPGEQFNIPSNQAAVYQLVLTNQSPEVVDNDIDMRIRVASQSNPHGAIVKIDGLDPNTYYTIPAGANVVKTLTVERGPVYIDYDSLMVIFSSACSEDIADTAYISVHFIPTCTELALINPTNNWILNADANNLMPVQISDYNYNYGVAQDSIAGNPVMLGLNKIGFEMKPATSSTWLQIEQFLKYPGATDSVIPSNSVYTQYPWIVDQIPDGNYELRAKSYCLNHDGSFSTKTSPVFAGVMDRIKPSPFGTPNPGDGILDPNDDISIQFNEPLDLGSISWSNFQVRGVLNGADLRHAEFVYLDGTDDYIEVSGGVGLQNKNFTVEFWARPTATGVDQVVVSQGMDPQEALFIGFTTANRMRFNINGQEVTTNAAVPNITDWNHYAVVYNKDLNEAYLYQNGVLLNGGSVNLAATYGGSSKLYFGKQMPQDAQHYTGNLHEVRIWNRIRTAADITSNFNKVLNTNTAGLVHNWQMTETEGIIIEDQIRQRNATMKNGTNWQVEPNGFAVTFDGTDDYLQINAATIPVTKTMDATIEFWFNSTQSGAATLLSSGKGDGLSQDSLFGWEINKDAMGRIHLLHHGLDYIAADSNYFDGSWHHFAVIINRSGNLSTYVDGNLKHSVQSTSFGAFSGSYYTAGARGYVTGGGSYLQDQHFQGSMDEIRIWNTARKLEQVKRDIHNRLQGDEFGLLAYIPAEAYSLVLGVPQLTANTSNQATAFPLAVATPINGTATSGVTPVVKIPRPVQTLNYSWSLNNDKIIITPTTAPELLENQTIDITVKNLFDLHGNQMESPKTWIAYFNKNQVIWQDDVIEHDIALDSVVHFTATILNTGGALKTFNLSGIPSWLTSDITSGTINPNSSQVVHFTVPAGLNVGEYYADVALTTDFNYDEILRISLKVHGTPPNWVLNPNNFEYSMSVIGEIELDGVINGNTETLIAGFMHDSICALGHLQYVPSYDRYEVFLNLLSNQQIGDLITFQVYDANSGLVYVDVSPSIYFTDGDLLGTLSAPVTFSSALTMEKQIPLNNGWTWISLPLSSNDQGTTNDLFSSVEAINGNVVKGLTNYDQFNASTGWIGSITNNGGYLNTKTYKVKLSQADTLHLIGQKIHPDSSYAEIQIVPGYNWIGYISMKNLAINEALGNYNAMNGDLIKSQYEFAYYDSINASWTGSLTVIRPGQGYVLKTGQAATFHYPLATFLRPVSETGKTLNPYYALDANAFEQSMSLTVKSNFCAANYADNMVLGAFTESGELRGYAISKQDEFSGKWFYYLTVHGDQDGEELQLKFFNNANGILYPTSYRVPFQQDAFYGTNTTPVCANVVNAYACDFGDEENQSDEATFVVEPNPFDATFMVSLDKERNGIVELLDAQGKVVFKESMKDANRFLFDSQKSFERLSNGVYILRVTYDNGELDQKRVLKISK